MDNTFTLPRISTTNEVSSKHYLNPNFGVQVPKNTLSEFYPDCFSVFFAEPNHVGINYNLIKIEINDTPVSQTSIANSIIGFINAQTEFVNDIISPARIEKCDIKEIENIRELIIGMQFSEVADIRENDEIYFFIFKDNSKKFIVRVLKEFEKDDENDPINWMLSIYDNDADAPVEHISGNYLDIIKLIIKLKPRY